MINIWEKEIMLIKDLSLEKDVKSEAMPPSYHVIIGRNAVVGNPAKILN